MITLTIQSGGKTQKLSFSQTEIYIGPKNGSLSDIHLDEEGLHDPHCKIILEETHYTIYNDSNDPTLKVDDLCFGRRTLIEGSTITLGSSILTVETTEALPEPIEELLQEVEALSIEPEEKPEPVQSAPAQKKSRRLPLLLAVATLMLLICSYLGTNYAISAGKLSQMTAKKTLADHAMNLFMQRTYGFPVAKKGFSNKDFKLTKDKTYLIATPRNALLARLAGQEPLSVDMEQMHLYEGKRLITLEELDESFPEEHFAPPQNARALCSEACNRLYNAPRYSHYQLSLDSEQELAGPFAILYTTEGKEKAKDIASQYITESSAPFFVSYQEGKSPQRVTRVANLPKPKNLLQELLARRSKALRSYKEEIVAALEKAIKEPKNQHFKHLHNLLSAFEEQDTLLQEKIAVDLETHYQSGRMSGEQIASELQREGLGDFLDNGEIR